MNVLDCHDIKYVGQAVLSESDRHWEVNYHCDKELQNNKSSRIYFILMNNEIVKIGCSESIGGIKQTLKSYSNANSIKGDVSIRTFGINYLIKNELENNNEVKFYTKIINPVDVKLNINGCDDIYNINVSAKSVEKIYVDKYKKINNRVPLWNFKEASYNYSDDIRKLYDKHNKIRKRIKNKKKVNRWNILRRH